VLRSGPGWNRKSGSCPATVGPILLIAGKSLTLEVTASMLKVGRQVGDRISQETCQNAAFSPQFLLNCGEPPASNRGFNLRGRVIVGFDL